jgi:hypothetical protein
MDQIELPDLQFGALLSRGSALTVLLLMLHLLAATAQTQAPQTSSSCPIEGPSPAQVVEQIWLWATQGELLKPDGWQRANGYFSKPAPYQNNKLIWVVSNYWGPAEQQSSLKVGKAQVFLGFWDLGKIDSTLNLLPAPKTDYEKMATLYYLVPVPGYIGMYGPDGKTLLFKKPTGKCGWQIEGEPGTPWTTVNTAIRYVLEARDKTRDPVIKKNADQTLNKLRLLH